MPLQHEQMEAVLGVPSSADLARHLGRRLRYLRAQLGVNQRELAARAGTPRTHLSRLENGKALPQVATLARLALSLGVGIAELVHGIPALKKEHLPQIDVRETRHP